MSATDRAITELERRVGELSAVVDEVVRYAELGIIPGAEWIARTEEIVRRPFLPDLFEPLEVELRSHRRDGRPLAKVIPLRVAPVMADADALVGSAVKMEGP